jgi:hypothetical protein
VSLDALMWQDVVSVTADEPTFVKIDFEAEDAAQAPAVPEDGGETEVPGETVQPGETVAADETEVPGETEGPEETEGFAESEGADEPEGADESGKPEAEDAEAEEETRASDEAAAASAEEQTARTDEPAEAEAPASTEETDEQTGPPQDGRDETEAPTAPDEADEEPEPADSEAPVRARASESPDGAVPVDEEAPTETPSEETVEAPPPGRLHVRVDRAAQLFVDGEPKVRLDPTDSEEIALPPGRHQLRAEAVDGPERWEQDVIAEADVGRSLQIALDRTMDADRGTMVSAAALQYGGVGAGAVVLLLALGWWALSNEAPLASPDRAITISEPVVLDVVANDRDPDQDPLRVRSVATLADSVGRVEIVDSTRLRIEPAADFAGIARIGYVVADAPGDTARAHVTLQVPFDGSQKVVTRRARRPQNVHAASLDGDGLDVAIAALDTRAVGWVPNARSGAGRFDSLNVLKTSEDGAVDVHAADLTGNGRSDVLSASLRADAVTWYENRADSAFGAPQPITTEADGPVAVQTADVDADGDADVIVGALLDREILWYENKGGGRFGAGNKIASGVRGLETLHVTDLDNDDTPDLLAVSYRDSTVSRYEPQMTAADTVRFESGPPISTDLAGPIEVHTADVTGNGWSDVLVGMAGARSVVLIENRTDTTGTLQFGDGRVLASDVETVEGIDTGDVEGDGTLDVFAGSFDSDTVVWFENEGEGQFRRAQVVATGVPELLSLEVADVNGDGTPDVLAASQAQNVVAWYENHLR